MSQEQNNSGENQQEQGDKISKKFDSNVKKLVALFSGEKAFKQPKVLNSELNSVIEELTKERKEELIKAFKAKATALLNSKVAFDKFVKEEEGKLKNAVNNKKKEFNTEMEECFKMVENIELLTQQYAETFKSMNSTTEEGTSSEK
jgi:ribosome recycling factor